MFLATYKTTLKNIVRAPTFWFLLFLFVLKLTETVPNPSSEFYDPELKEWITETDPRFVLGLGTFTKRTSQSVSSMMSELIPFFTAVTTVLVLNRDYGDSFYEIEKAAGIKPRHYLLGRLLALGTLLVVISVVVCFTFFHTYILMRGGVPSLDWVTYFTASAVRLLRYFIFTAIPTILFYVAFTYCIGALFRSGIPAAVVSIGYVVLNTVVYKRLRFRMNPFYFDYLAPSPQQLEEYFYSINRDLIGQTEVDGLLKMLDTNLEKAVLCICYLAGLTLIYSTIAYIFTRGRDR